MKLRKKLLNWLFSVSTLTFVTGCPLQYQQPNNLQSPETTYTSTPELTITPELTETPELTITPILIPTVEPILTPTPASTSQKQKGMNFVSWWYDQYSYPESDVSLENLVVLGTNSASLLVTEYQDTKNSTTIYADSQKTPTLASLEHAINKMHSLGMDIALKPHIDVKDGTWRGEIYFDNEADWQAWFNSYNQFITKYAQFAQDKGLDRFIVGTELVKTSNRENDWRNIITTVRANFSGKLTYSSNWDEFQNIAWWDDLDYIGVDAYFPLTNKDNPIIDEIKAAWLPHVTKIENIQSLFNKPVLFTEIGYRSINGANKEPWKMLAVDTQEQADCYRAALETFKDKPWFKGFYWWNWETNPNAGGISDTGFTPQNKPAQDILSEWYNKN